MPGKSGWLERIGQQRREGIYRKSPSEDTVIHSTQVVTIRHAPAQ
jgi:hypothetical protein